MNIKERIIIDIDSDIIKYINENDKEVFPEIIENDNRIEIFLALSKLRENIINWYPFKKDCTILEIGANYGEITEALCNNAKEVVSYEVLEQKKDALKKRHNKIKNLEIVNNIESLNKQFDYITLIGVEEITDNLEELLLEIKKYLKPDGIILLATNNKTALKHMISAENNEKDNKTYNIEELLKSISKAGFSKQKTYYPMTDYKLTNVIYTDERTMYREDISRNILYYDTDSVKIRLENEMYSELLKNNVDFRSIANSFFIEIFNDKYEENDIKFVSFSNMRKDKYKIKTIMTKDFVYKYANDNSSIDHIQSAKNNIDIMNKSKLKTLDSYDEEKIISKFVNAKTFDFILNETVKKDKEEAINLIQKFKQEIIDKLESSNSETNVFDKYKIKYSKKIMKNMEMVKYGLWDLIFQNCFYIDDEMYFYDQEWMDENIPVDFIMYRAIKYFDKIKKYIPEQELYNILEIDSEQVRIYEELEKKLQEEINNNKIWQMQFEGKTVNDLKEQKLTDNHKINLLNIELQHKNNEIASKENEIINKNNEIASKENEIASKNNEITSKNNEINELNISNRTLQSTINELQESNKQLRAEISLMKNSISWKITKPLRKIRGH